MSIYVRAIFAFPSFGLLSKLAYTVHISSAEGYTNMTFCILCGINSKHSDIYKKRRGYILKIITKLYVSRNDDTTSFCYKSLITILVVMMRRRRWTVLIWNIYKHESKTKYLFVFFTCILVLPNA